MYEIRLKNAKRFPRISTNKHLESEIENKLKKLLIELRGFKFVITLVLVFEKIESEDKTKYDTFYSNSKAEIIINESNIDDVFKSNYTAVISNIQKYLGKGSCWIIDLVIDHNISISNHNPLAGCIYYRIIKRNKPCNK